MCKGQTCCHCQHSKQTQGEAFKSGPTSNPWSLELVKQCALCRWWLMRLFICPACSFMCGYVIRPNQQNTHWSPQPASFTCWITSWREEGWSGDMCPATAAGCRGKPALLVTLFPPLILYSLPLLLFSLPPPPPKPPGSCRPFHRLYQWNISTRRYLKPLSVLVRACKRIRERLQQQTLDHATGAHVLQ